MKYNPRDENSIKAVMAKSNVVLNLIGLYLLLYLIYTSWRIQIKWLLFSEMAGREYETRNYSFEEVNRDMAEQLAVVCRLKVYKHDLLLEL